MCYRVNSILTLNHTFRVLTRFDLQNRGRSNFSIALVLLLGLGSLIISSSGCSTHTDLIRNARKEYYQGNLTQAVQHLDEGMKKKEKDRDVLLLDQSVAFLASGRVDEAERGFIEVRNRFDDLEQKNYGAAALSYFTDDTKRPYCGEDYEKVLIRVMLSLCSIMGDGVDAEAYALQINEKITQMATEAEKDGKIVKNYQQVAMGPYVYGLMREATLANYDDATRAYTRVVEWEPMFAAGHRDLQRAQFGNHSQPGHGVVYVFAMTGRGPYKEEVAEVPTSQAMLVADQIISMTSKHSVTPTLAPIKIPKVVTPSSSIRSVRVSVNGKLMGETETITDVSRIAKEQYDAVLPLVMGRAVARRAVKKATLYATKNSMNTSGLGEIAVDLVGIAWEASEAADTRCWSLLPEKIQVLRLELPAGQHTLQLTCNNGINAPGKPYSATVQVTESRNSFVLAQFPTEQLVGEILVNSR